MSRANINYDTSPELFCMKWNPLMSKFCYICKRCSTPFDTNLRLQRHKIVCFINSVCQSLSDDGHGQQSSGSASILSPRSAVFAASAVPLEYCGQKLQIPKITREEALKSKSTDFPRLRSGRRRATELNWPKSTTSSPDKQSHKNVCPSRRETVSTSTPSLRHGTTKLTKDTIRNKSQGTGPIKDSFPQEVDADMFSLKGYKIPKLKSKISGGREESKVNCKTPHSVVDNGIVPDSVPPPTPAKTTSVPLVHCPIEDKPPEKESQSDKVLLETSDYASNSSTGDYDSSGKDVDSDETDSRKSSSTPPPIDDAPTSPASRTTNLPTHLEIDEEEYARSEILEQISLQAKVGIINEPLDMDYYVILKSGDELECVDVFTDDDLDWGLEPGQVLVLQELEDDPKSDHNCVNYFDDRDPVEKDDGMHGQKVTQPGLAQHECHPLRVMDNQFNSHYDNEAQEMLDLELGAVETVVESEESFESEGDGSDDPKLNQHSTSGRPVSSHNSGKTRGKDSNAKTSSQPKSKRNLHNIPNNLLTSVLEKTLLVKLRRCDGALTSMPKLRPQPQEEEIDEVVICQEEEEESTHISSPASPIPEINSHSEAQPILDDSTPTTETSCVNPPLKRKHSKEEEEKWDIVNSVDLNESTSNVTPIKLKIKRRRLEVSVELNKPDNPTETTSINDTSSPQFFNGCCKICGTNLAYNDAKTYYGTSNPSKPFCCCTCMEIFNNEEWSVHNKVCHNLEEEECAIWSDSNNDPYPTATLVDKTVIQRDFICPNCFKSVSKLI